MESRAVVNSMPGSGRELLSRIVALAGLPDCAPAPLRRVGAHLGLRIGRPDVLSDVETARHLTYRSWRSLGARGEVVHLGTTSALELPSWLLDRWLESVPEGTHVLAHLPYSPQAAGLLADHEMRHVLLLRDPRAVLVGWLRAMTAEGHRLAADMAELGFEARLALALHGGYAPTSGLEVVGFAHVLDDMLAWSEEPHCEVVLYQDLVGPRGGGDPDAQRATVGRVLSHLGADAGEAHLRAVCDAAFDPAALPSVFAWGEGLTADQVRLVTDRLAGAVDAVEAYSIAHATI